MARKGAPDRRTISIHCRGCRCLLYRYRKGGTGGLVKCFVERIVEDRTAGDLRCPTCGQQFAREWALAGKPVQSVVGTLCFGLALASVYWKDGVVPDPLIAGASAPLVFLGVAVLAVSGYALAVAVSLPSRRDV